MEDCILLYEDYLNGCIGSCFCFNFQENLFIIVGGGRGGWSGGGGSGVTGLGRMPRVGCF